MHFPIIQLCGDPEDIGVTPSEMYEDSVIQSWTDYIGDKYTDEERDGVIKSEWLKSLFEGIADIDPDKGTITFLSKDKITETLQKYFSDVIEKLSELDINESIYMLFWNLRDKGTHYKDCYFLFWKDGYAQTSMGFIEDTPFNAGETLYIGDIYDAHF